ncbi:3-keto-disaccharide hydrolase [Adhaeretor mobilis]|uniref:3-keto-alpha-glucoside-1,2-lyase/3-keto-2-hydroxy-glucal hydratase domain-containing protein n=1 Tax=Adhaeretor mobilis TaxID=1930276 RepID=A0A517MQC2_9BACT|nr:DUF1080 domain-containing protein [Adhaeretor mobilis]QDS97085.1 hypothetical protein HG15A2_03450 [Adhaeretor mobilis]
MNTQRLLVTIWALTTGLVLSSVVSAQQEPLNVWKAELDSTGDWFDPTLWTEGVPQADHLVHLVNRSETQLQAGQAEAAFFSLNGQFGSIPQVSHTGGSLDVGGLISIQNGIYQLIGGQLEAEELSLGGWELHRLSGFDFDAAGVPLPENLCPNPLALDFFCTVLFATKQRFEIQGGVATINGQVSIRQGQLEMSGGQLNAESLLLDTFGLVDDFRAFLPYGGNPPGDIDQSGGQVNLESELKIQNGRYALSGGRLTVGGLAMGDPALDDQSFFTGQRTPRFQQTGGELVVQGNLEMCIPGFGILEPLPLFTDVAYLLEAGSITVGGDTIVGSLGVAPAQFLQSGGTHRTAGTLRIEGTESIYELSGGHLQVGTLEVGTGLFNEGGAFSITPAAELIVESRVTLGALAEVAAVPGAQIHLEGGQFEIQGTDSQLLAGLANLSLVVTGGDWSTLEAASSDLGQGEEGFVDNFAWGSLVVGSITEAGRLRLSDQFGNQTNLLATDSAEVFEALSVEFQEALYVDHLVVAEGSTLDLAGRKLYYRTADITGEVLLSGGALIAAVPEPTSLGISLLAVFACNGTFFRWRLSWEFGTLVGLDDPQIATTSGANTMRRIFSLLVICSLAICTTTHAQEGSATKGNARKATRNNAADDDKTVMLFNGKDLDGWDFYLGKAKQKMEDVWSVEDGILKCKGKPAGYIFTKKSDYENYVLTLQWRWPNKGGNNGVLVHCTGKKDVIGVWPQSLEVQMKADNAGDFWVIGTEIDVPNEDKRVEGRRHLNLNDGAEKKLGEWNDMEITCQGAEVIVKVNGKLVNHGTNSTVTKGAICLQSEGTPIEYRKVVLRQL